MSEDLVPHEQRWSLAVPAARVDVVELGPDEWRRWRSLRRAALGQAPYAFGSTLAQWSGAGDTEERWRARFAGVAHNLLVVRDGRDVAMVSLSAPGTDGTPPELLSMWVAPEVRGTGVGDAAVAAVLARAAEAYPGREVVLSVFADNEAAVRLYARHGFADVGVSPDDPRERRMVHEPS